MRNYARQRRVPFDTTPGGHRRFDIGEAVAALSGASSNEQDAPETGTSDSRSLDTPEVRVEPRSSVTVTCAPNAVGKTPVIAYDTDEDRDAWAGETAVV